MVNVGDSVSICDEQRVDHVALVIAIHGWTTPEQKADYVAQQVERYERDLAATESEEQKARIRDWIDGAKRQTDVPFSPSCINVVYVSKDPAKHDPYGNQLERLSSLQHESMVQNMTVPGRFYRL